MEQNNKYYTDYDSKILLQITSQLESKGYFWNNVVHIGDNVFEMDFGYNAPLAGREYRGIITIENNEIKILNQKLIWMS